MTVSIWWIRRDQRLNDNPALLTAIQNSDQVLPLFILDPILLEKTPNQRLNFLYSSLSSLDTDLRSLGSKLVTRFGYPLEIFSILWQQYSFQAIYAEEDFTPFSQKRDAIIANQFPLTLVHGQTVHHPLMLHKPDGQPYSIFTPFSKTWKGLLPEKLIPLPAPSSLTFPDIFIESIPLPAGNADPNYPVGEKEAIRRLDQFFQGPIFEYKQLRDRMDVPGTSELSPYFHLGVLSLRQATAQYLDLLQQNLDKQQKESCETWLSELIWREFFISIFALFPDSARDGFRPEFRNIRWENSSDLLYAWQHGLTGFPCVDAGMRQLSEIGWMHNRARMITASFLVKNCLVDWHKGEKWFIQHLIDGDVAVNNGNWQWTAGVGTDAAPYFRVFNPVLQSQKFDPHGDYIRRWVPECSKLPTEFIHSPWKAPKHILKQSKCVLGKDYPHPILDLAATRLKALQAYQSAKRHYYEEQQGSIREKK